MNVIEVVKQEINKVIPDNEVILFGSRARGDYKKDSDWDFLILSNAEPISKKKKEEVREKLYEIELRMDEVISSIIYSKADWERRSITPIYQIIKKEDEPH